jgi:hypothetical protein
MNQWCEQLLARLPELEWRLPVWPTGYKKHIPEELFQNLKQLTPDEAFKELRHHVFQLKQMDESSLAASFLAEKIAKQIEVLVDLGKKLPIKNELNFKPGLTRKQQMQRLYEKKQHLLEQQKALGMAWQRLQLPAIQDEMAVLQHQLQQIENMLSRN